MTSKMIDGNEIDAAQLTGAIEALRRELARLDQRVLALEQTPRSDVHEPPPRKDKTPNAEGISDELMLVIAAAIAAYLGVRPRIGQIRLLQSNPWSQQGRVTIQASHALAVRHG